jgi:two-component sensor histidine kinase
MLAEWLRRITDHAFAPYSVSAFAFAVGCVAVATCVRYALGWIHPGVLPFVAHFPAVMIVALVAGTPAAIVATLLSIILATALFVPESGQLEILNSAFFALSCIIIIVVAEAYRQLLRRYQKQERQRNLMLRELEHRGKNMRSVVEAIVAQTLPDDPDAAETIVGRIRAVSSTNDIISHAANLQPDLRTLIRAKFEPFGPFRASLDGGEITLPADSARNLSLVFHELVTNAIKHGALSREEGRVDISWRANGGNLTITWAERDGPEISPPEQRGFGTRLVVGCMKSLGGSIIADFPPSGLVCVISLPHKAAAAETAAAK